MKKYLFTFLLVSSFIFSIPVSAAIYGLCCEVCDDEGFEYGKNSCDCQCSKGDLVEVKQDRYCCSGIFAIASSGTFPTKPDQINPECCKHAGGNYYELEEGEEAGEHASPDHQSGVCCYKGSSKSMLSNTLNDVCCDRAGGAIRGTGANKKCCRQSTQGS